ncbi:MAG: DUF3604 domain-containing protein, partial [Myxococcales bacterium]|nr:DUF3604 domain-containing protein [Myxococcales bacterium]
SLAAQRRARDEAGRALASRADGAAADDTTILFGDLHVHTSYSSDGFLFSLPMLGGDGAHPPNDACDFARHCANLDFFALTDHAESLAPEHWTRSKESVRACNARAGDGGDADLVAFMGFEWSQMGLTPDDHWGHRCVVFPETDDARLPARPIAAADTSPALRGLAAMARSTRVVGFLDWPVHERFAEHHERLAERPLCPDGVASPDIEGDACLEVAREPKDLHRKLDEWGLPALVIPHGTTWGVYTPASTTFDKHLAEAQYAPERMPLVEIMSGHGNSEEFRAWREIDVAADGTRTCPAHVAGHLTCCERAGQIMRERCGDLPADECERRVERARTLAANTWVNPFRVFPDTTPEDWLDCDQCRDCFKPSFGYRPRESVQYAMTLADPDAGEGRRRFRFGFVASSDGHTGRPGNAYKQSDPSLVSDVRGTPEFPYGMFQSMFSSREMEDPRMPVDPGATTISVGSQQDLRVSSFLFPAGLAAVHARGRSREAIWSALARREAYGTSGPRILLWFDITNAPGADGGRAPMGSQHAMGANPRFEVRAVGSFEPKPGCPEESRRALSPERLAYLCHDECYFPSDVRRPIAAIEVVRIRPRTRADESPAELIDDPWRRFECAPDPAGCRVAFEDETFAADGRDALYYARAIEAPSMALNGAPLETELDANGEPSAIRPCTQARVDEGGCPSPVGERAWSSPIFVDFAREAAPAPGDA